MTLTRCMGRQEHIERFYPKKLGACPECGCPPGAYNPHLYRVKVDNGLLAQADAAVKQRNLEDAVLHRGATLPWAREAAAEMRRNGTLDIAAHVLAGD